MINRLLDLDILDEENNKSFRSNKALCQRVEVRVVTLNIDGIFGDDKDLEMKALRNELARDMFEYRTKVSYPEYTKEKSLSNLFQKFTIPPTKEEESVYDEKMKQLDSAWHALQYQGLNSLYQEWLETDGGGNGVNKELHHITLDSLSRTSYKKKINKNKKKSKNKPS